MGLDGAMMDTKDITHKVETVQDLLTAKFGIKRRPLAQMMMKAGRRLPGRLHKRARVLSDAQALGGHPKLARQMDMAAVDQAYEDCVAHLTAIDVADRRKGRVLGIAGAIVFNLLIVLVGFVLWLWWRGYV